MSASRAQGQQHSPKSEQELLLGSWSILPGPGLSQPMQQLAKVSSTCVLKSLGWWSCQHLLKQAQHFEELSALVVIFGL